MNKILENAQVGFSFVLREGEKDTVYYINKLGQMKERKLPSSIFEGREGAQMYVEMLENATANYRWSGDVIEAFDPTVEEYENVKLPVYNEDGVYLEDKFFEKIPTIKMLERATMYVEAKLQRYILEGRIQDGLKYNKNNVCTVVDTYYKITPEFIDTGKYEAFLINLPYGNEKFNLSLIVDKSMVKRKVRNGTLHMYVPAETVDFVLGKIGLCSRSLIAHKLGIARVEVKAI